MILIYRYWLWQKDFIVENVDIDINVHIKIDKENRTNTDEMDIWHIEEPYLPTSSWDTHHLGRWAQLPPHGSHSEEIGVVLVLHCIILYCICFYLIVLYWILSSNTDMWFSYDMDKYIVSDCNHHGGENPSNSREPRRAEAVKCSARAEIIFQISNSTSTLSLAPSPLPSPGTGEQWTHQGHSYLRRWAKVRSRAFQSLQKSVKFCVITCSV